MEVCVYVCMYACKHMWVGMFVHCFESKNHAIDLKKSIKVEC